MKQLTIIFLSLLFFSCNRTPVYKSKGFFPVKEFGKWGYINSDGQKVIECQFEWAGAFTEGLAPFHKDTLYGFIDTTGKIVIEPRFEQITQFSDGLCRVTIQKDTTYQTAFIRTDGSIAFTTTYEDIGPFSEGRAEATINNEVCYIDKSGHIVFNTHFPYGSGQFYEGVSRVWGGHGGWVQKGSVEVWEGDTTEYYDVNGKLITVLIGTGFNDFSEGLALISVNDSDCYIDKTGRIRVKVKDTKLTCFSFSDGLAQVTIAGVGHKSGFIDTTGNTVIPIMYHDIYDFNNGLAAYRDKNFWGFIDKKGKVAIKPQFEEIEAPGFNNGLCRVKQNHQWGYINRDGKFVWKEQSGIEYGKLDLSKWKLDTLEIDKPFNSERDAWGENYPRKQIFPSLDALTLRIDTTDLTVFADEYFAYKLYMINAGKDTINIPAQDGRIKIIQQAKNKKGEWQDIENFINSWCGNSYHTLHLLPDEYQIFATPVFKGGFITQLRFRLALDKQEIYSNSYTGRINYGQFLNPKDKDKTGIVLWTEYR